MADGTALIVFGVRPVISDKSLCDQPIESSIEVIISPGLTILKGFIFSLMNHLFILSRIQTDNGDFVLVIARYSKKKIHSPAVAKQKRY